MRFEDKICIVTGAGSGIGRATALRFASEGGRVAVVDLSSEQGQRTVDVIVNNGGDALLAYADVSAPPQVKAAVQATVERWGSVHVLVNNAAIMTFQPIVELSEEDWDRVLAVNLRSAFLFAKYALPHMPPGGAIVNVSSVHAHETTANVVPYAASKGGIEAFTRALSRECEGSRIRVNCVDPGAIDTPMLWTNPNVKSGREKIEGAIGSPEDVAAAICFLASEEARFINGTSLVVDGGRLNIL